MHEKFGAGRLKERGRWTEAIVRDEAARPADISEVFLKDWEQRDDEIRTRQLKVIILMSLQPRPYIFVFLLGGEHTT